jgi:DNA-binding XRE family transcriptional regulator
MVKLTLKACRVNVNASAAEMAEALGVTEDTVYNWEKGKYMPTAKNIVKILDFFESRNFPIAINDINFLR